MNPVTTFLWCTCLCWTAVPLVATGSSRSNITLAFLGQEDTLLHIAPNLDRNSTGSKPRYLCQPAIVLDPSTNDCLTNVTTIGPVRSVPQVEATVRQKTAIINNSTATLPSHQLQFLPNCVQPNQLMEIVRAEGESQPLVIMNFITCFSENVLINLLEEAEFMAPEALFLYRTDFHHLNYEQEPTSVTKQQASFLAEYKAPFFFPYPTPSDLYEAVFTFVHQMGWRRAAFIQQCTNPLPETLVAHLKDWAQFKQSGAIPSHADTTKAGLETLFHADILAAWEETTVASTLSDSQGDNNSSGGIPSEGLGSPYVFGMLQDLDVLEVLYDRNPHSVLEEVYQNELRIIIFAGQLCEYFNLLVEAHKKLLYGPG